MMCKLLFSWALLASAVQAMRMQGESYGEGQQSELDGKESAANAKPWQALMTLLVAFNPSAAFSFGPGALNRRHAGDPGSSQAISRGPALTMVEHGYVPIAKGGNEQPAAVPNTHVRTTGHWTNGVLDESSRQVWTDYEMGNLDVDEKNAKVRAPLTVEQDGIAYQPAGTDVDFGNMVNTLSAASLMSPTGEKPSNSLAGGIVGNSPMLATLDAWFQANPDGVVALPLGPDGFTGEQDANTMYPRGIASGSPSQVNPRSGSPVVMSADSDAFVPDMQRRTIMNLVLLGGAAVPVGWLGGGFVYFFVPAGGSGGGAGLVAKDALGDDVLFDKWLSTHQEGDRNLVQGLKGDAHYLIVTADKKIEDYALNAVCTHLGCVVPWNRAAGKFICPCHGSQYDNTGKVVRGPAPLSLALAHVDNVDNKVTLTPWTETDFRTNTAPWWK